MFMCIHKIPLTDFLTYAQNLVTGIISSLRFNFIHFFRTEYVGKSSHSGEMSENDLDDD